MFYSFFELWLLTFGEFEMNHSEVIKTQEGAYLFLVSTGVLTLILMNLIIAIMSDTYEKVMTSIVDSDNRQLNKMILQYEKILLWKRK